MTKRPTMITTRPILYSEISQLIELDHKVIVEESSIPVHEAPPRLTYAELEKAISVKDCLEWIYYGTQLAGYYWFERKPDTIYIAGVIISKCFQGKGLSSHILNFASQKAQEWQLSKSKLAVHPINGSALSAYFKHGYRITACVQDFFGPAFPHSFRCIMEKKLDFIPEADLSQEMVIPCHHYSALKKATDEKYVGVGLVRSSKDNFGNSVIFKSARHPHFRGDVGAKSL